MKNRTVFDLKKMAQVGGSFRLNLEEKKLTVMDLKGIATAMAESGFSSQLIINNHSRLSSQDLVQIAKAGNGCVFFD